MGIFHRSVIDLTKVIYKATAKNQSRNWDRWYKLLIYIGVEDKLLDRIHYRSRTTLVSSLAASVQRNQFGTTKKTKVLHGTVKSAI